jgi:ribonuclease T
MPQPHDREVLISVDVETSGPTPGTGSLIAIGACLVDRPDVGFYRELQPIVGLPWDPGAERVHGLSETRLDEQGLPPGAAMADMGAWVAGVCAGGRPVFVGFNAPFDWMFVADYFHRFLGGNPFGFAALDLKALFMGRCGVAHWADTTMRQVLARYPVDSPHTHHALDDARMQAAIARRLLDLPEPPGA